MPKHVRGMGGRESPVGGCHSLISFGYLSKIAGRDTSCFSIMPRSPIPAIPEAKESFLTPSVPPDTHPFGGFGLKELGTPCLFDMPLCAENMLITQVCGRDSLGEGRSTKPSSGVDLGQEMTITSKLHP